MPNLVIPKSFDSLPVHKRIADRAVAKLANDSRVTGLYLTGSFAQGTPDEFSDIDLNILVPDAERTQIIQDHESLIKTVGEVFTSFPATHLGDPNQVVVFYEEEKPIHVDYQYKVIDQLIPNPAYASAHILLDRLSRLTAWRKACQQLPKDHSHSLEDIQYFEDRFWGWIWYTYSKIARGELWEARNCVESLRNSVILKLLHYELSLQDQGNRRVESRFPLEYVDLLEQTIPAAHAKQAYTSALLHLIDVYSSAIAAVAHEHGLNGLKRANRDYIVGAIRRG